MDCGRFKELWLIVGSEEFSEGPAMLSHLDECKDCESWVRGQEEEQEKWVQANRSLIDQSVSAARVEKTVQAMRKVIEGD